MLGCPVVKDLFYMINHDDDRNDPAWCKFLFNYGSERKGTMAVHALAVHAIYDFCNWRRHGTYSGTAKAGHLLSHMLHTARAYRTLFNDLRKAMHHMVPDGRVADLPDDPPPRNNDDDDNGRRVRQRISGLPSAALHGSGPARERDEVALERNVRRCR